MTRLFDPVQHASPFGSDPRPLPNHDPLRGALLDSRQRWHDLVSLAADLAFETDAAGRFVFLASDPVLGWPTATLLGQPAELLLTGTSRDLPDQLFNPFRPATPIRRQRVWLKRADRSVACVSFTAAPLFDPRGRIIGARGVGIDMSDQDAAEVAMVATLRRGELVDHILWLMRQEVLPPRMMQAALQALSRAVGAEGAAILDIVVGSDPDSAPGPLKHQAGGGGEAQAVAVTAMRLMQAEMIRAGAARMRSPQNGTLADAASAMVPADNPAIAQGTGADGRPVLTCTCQTRFGAHAGLMLWRAPGASAWNAEDSQLVAAAASIVRVVLEHEAIQLEMARQARTDPLTGLLNRRAFLEEVARHLDRLDRENVPGTLVFIDFDNFKLLNDRLGHEHGDRMLCAAATLLRDTVRPTDLVARFGGDKFAIWLNGADHMTAAERAERLRVDGPRRLDELASPPPTGTDPAVESNTTMSIGIATRRSSGGESIENLIRRADLAMYEVKRTGRGHWRVSPEEA